MEFGAGMPNTSGVRRRVLALALFGLLLACTSPPAASVTLTGTPLPPATPPLVACIDELELEAHKSKTIASLTDVAEALGQYDFAAATLSTRIASSEARAMADAAAPGPDSRIEAHLTRTADALDNAASALADTDVNNATSYISQATNEMQQAVALFDLSMYC